MILLDSKPIGESTVSESQEFNVPDEEPKVEVKPKKEKTKSEETTSDDIPF